MKKISIFILPVIFAFLLSCGPSADSLAKKHCDLFEKYYQAELAKDSSKMVEFATQMQAMDSELIQKYQHRNPELLLQYVKLKEKCILDYVEKNNPPQ